MLTDVVVQVPRDPRPLDILRLDQSASQVANFSMTLPERFLRILALGDIETAADVSGVAAILFVFRNAGVQDPSVDAVSASETVLHQNGLTSLNRRNVDTLDAITVIGMNSVQPPFIQQLLQGHSRELNTELVQVVEGRIWPCRPHDHWRIVRQVAKKRFALAERAVGTHAAPQQGQKRDNRRNQDREDD